jgi:Sulfotransferase family
MESPVFVMGAERSGTTLLRLMLDGHPQLSMPFDFGFALDWPETPGSPWPEPFDYWELLADSREARKAQIVIDASLALPDLVRSLLRQMQRRTQKPLVGASASRHFERVLRLWPEARFIYLVRDGRDVARSHVAQGWAGNVWSAAAVWRAAEREWRRISALIPRENRIEVRYEDLIRGPKRELSRIASFLDLEYAPEMLDYPVRSAHGAPDPRFAERWREQLSVRELGWLEREIGPELRARGYPPSCVPAAWIPAPRRVALRLGDRAGRLQFRVRRHAARLWVQHQVARRFRRAFFARPAALRVRAIDAAFLE